MIDDIDDNLRRLWSAVRKRTGPVDTRPSPQAPYVAADKEPPSTQPDNPTDHPERETAPTVPAAVTEPLGEPRIAVAVSAVDPLEKVQLGPIREVTIPEGKIRPPGPDSRPYPNSKPKPISRLEGAFRRLLRWFGLNSHT